MTDLLYKYAAFISYSHADEAEAKRLHRRLENYRVPSRLVGTTGTHGPIPKRIGVCFRDDAELSASSILGDTLRQALRDSRTLIVICSPRSSSSHWVNEEIRYFRSLGRADSIFALIVDGEVKARDPSRNCFPAALLHDDSGVSVEPLAADARDGRTESFLKLAAGILGIAFGELQRREFRRRRRVVSTIVASAISIAALTSALAITAYRARDEAVQRRSQANDLVDFMLGDLKDRLEPVGRLDVLDAVVAKTMTYLNQNVERERDDDVLAQRVRALAAIEDIRDSRGQMTEAAEAGLQALNDARALSSKAPQHDYLLALALHAYGESLAENDKYDPALESLEEGRSVIHRARLASPDDLQMRLLDAQLASVEGYVYASKKDFENAATQQAYCADLLRPAAEDVDARSAVVSEYWRCRGHEASALVYSNHLEAAISKLISITTELPALLAARPNDRALQHDLSAVEIDASIGFSRAGWSEQSGAYADRAAEISRRLIAFDPTNFLDKLNLGEALYYSISAKIRSGALQDAQTLAREGASILAEVREKHPDDLEAIDYSMAILTQQADITMALTHDLPAALAKDDAAIALGQSLRVPRIEFKVLDSELDIWELADSRDLARAKSARLAASTLLESLSGLDAGLTKVQKIRLKKDQMEFAYLSGDPGIGDQLYAELRDAHASNMAQVTDFRHRLCARLNKAGPPCAHIEEWTPEAKP